jgi:hypothetical protein
MTIKEYVKRKEDNQGIVTTLPSELTEQLKKSIEHEIESRGMQLPPEPDATLIASGGKHSDYDLRKRKVVRISYKTEYESAFRQKERLRVQRNLAIALAACYIFVDLLIKIFS